MKSVLAAVTAICVILGLSLAWAQPQATNQSTGEASGENVAANRGIQYRVLTVEELFQWDPSLAQKADQIAISSTYSDGSQYRHGDIRRIDMDAADFQLALNRMAAEGWKLEAVTKANYWVFSK